MKHFDGRAYTHKNFGLATVLRFQYFQFHQIFDRKAQGVAISYQPSRFIELNQDKENALNTR